jgi:hypothetical protein
LSPFALSVVGVTLGGMDVTYDLLARASAEDLRVPLAEFGMVWRLAEYESMRIGVVREFPCGVAETCRWLAAQPMWSVIWDREEMPRAPMSQRIVPVTAETVDAELRWAHGAHGHRALYAQGVVAALEWAWQGTGRPPLDVSPAAAS